MNEIDRFHCPLLCGLEAQQRRIVYTSRVGGFTLVEVLTVIIIAALISAAVATGFSQVPRMKLRESARKMAGMIRFVSGRARTSRSLLRLVMDLDHESSTIMVQQYPQGQPPPVRDPYIEEEEVEKFEWRYENWLRFDPANPVGPVGLDDTGKPFLPPIVQWEALKTSLKTLVSLEGVRISRVVFPCLDRDYEEGKVGLVFYPNGTNDGAVILLRSSGGHEMSVIVDPMDGGIRFESGFTVPSDLCVDAEGNELPTGGDDE